jgi:hypothetical protein
MQVNSAQDYLTAQKRRIVAATFAQTPPPRHRNYNSTYLSVLANSETVYNKVPYPQTLSLAPGSAPGGLYTASGSLVMALGQSNRPVINDCARCTTVGVNNARPGSLI